MTPLPILLATVFLGTGNCPRELFPAIGYSRLGVHEVKAKSVLERYRDILG